MKDTSLKYQYLVSKPLARWVLSILCLFSAFSYSQLLNNPGPQVKLLQSIAGHNLKGINAVIQGKSGFLWLGTRQGLLRFDGYQIKRFEHQKNNPNSLSQNNVRQLVQDEDGIIWLITRGGGLNRFDPQNQSFKLFVHVKGDNSSLSSNQLNSIQLGKGNVLWLSSERGINQFNRKTFQNTRLNAQLQPLPNEESVIVAQVFEDAQGGIWVSEQEGGLSMHNPERSKQVYFQYDVNDPKSIAKSNAYLIYQTPQGVIWIGTSKAIHRFNPDTLNFDSIVIALRKDAINDEPVVVSIMQDSIGQLWVGSIYNGVSVLKPGAISPVNVNQDLSIKNSLNAFLVNHIFQDRSGAIWFVASKRGLYKLNADAQLFEHWIASTKSDARISTLFTDVAGVQWLGAAQDLYRFNQRLGDYELVAKEVGYIAAMAQGVDNTLILALGEKGLFTYDPKNRQLTNYGTPYKVGNDTAYPALPINTLHSMIVDEQGTLWAGLFRSTNQTSGLFSFEGKSNQYIQHLDKYTIETILPIGNLIIVGTRRNGLNIFNTNTKQWSVVQDPNNKVNTVLALLKDAQNQIWVGTHTNGLAQLNLTTKTFSFPTIDQGLPSNSIRSIVQDQQGLLWLGTGKGICLMDITSKAVRCFDERDGLRVGAVQPESATITASGHIVMADDKHVVKFLPSRVIGQTGADDKSFPLVLSDFRLFNKPVELQAQEATSPLKQNINSTDKLTLSHENYWFSLAFATSNYGQSETIRYAYMLEGFTDQWIEADADNRIATFTSLPADDFVFKVKTSNRDGSWRQDYRELHITITPPWWKTWIAYFVYALVTVFSVYAVYRYRTKALVQRADELELGVIQRTATINRLMLQKERMFANISHEFKTPLTLILNPLESISLQQGVEDFSRKVSMMKRNGQRLLRMIDQLLELSKLETTDAQQNYYFSLAETLNMLLVSFQPLVDSKNLSMTPPTFDDVVLSLKADSLEMILTNLISNAIKYTPANGEISVEVSQKDGQVVIAVKDTGVGISEQNQAIVFNRFTRANELHDENIPGAGIGLALVKELVEDNGGAITLVSEIKNGSTFTVTLPISEDQGVEVQKIKSLSNTSKIEIDSLQLPTNALVMPTINTQDSESSLPTLLLIDDNPDMLELLVDTLASHYQCITAQNGKTGLALAEEHLPDLVISDVMMPGISGFEVVKHLKQEELTCHIPVILLTAKGDSQSRIRGWTEKADEYLEKPFNATELLIRIQSLLSIRSLLRHRYQREFTLPQQSQSPMASQLQAEPLDSNTVDAQEGVNQVNQVFFERINTVLEKHYTDESLDVALLAGELAMSHRQLGRKMKSMLDLTPAESIRSFRLKKAAEQLNQGVSPSVVAHQVGFTSHSYFSQCFKAQYDCMPSSYVPGS
jgi:signal transduction histidine kinase/DNA-binding response OmpR family regulator/streptogramin lyase